MHILGIGGHMRRIYDPTKYGFLLHLQPLNTFETISAIVLGFAQFLLIANLFYSLKKGEPAGENPWEANTLEWTVPSPPPHHNFDVIPTVYHGPYEYSSPDEPRDYLPQSQPPGAVVTPSERIV
jgi:cytochrome c oxidase subunit 1